MNAWTDGRCSDDVNPYFKTGVPFRHVPGRGQQLQILAFDAGEGGESQPLCAAEVSVDKLVRYQRAVAAKMFLPSGKACDAVVRLELKKPGD